MAFVRDSREETITSKMEFIASQIDDHCLKGQRFPGYSDVKKFNEEFEMVKTLVAAGENLPAIRMFIKIMRGE